MPQEECKMKRGLILDMNSEHRELLFYALQTLDYEAQLANSPSEFIQLAEAEFFDVVMLDIELPEMNGLALVEQIRQVAPGSLFMVFSVYDEDLRISQAHYAGADAYIIKPFNLRQVLKFIRENDDPMYRNSTEISVL
jgi:DNA-binding response OmpR family regulator